MKNRVPRILIVDDNDSICKMLSLILENEGYEVQTACNGKEAIEKSKTTIFDLALLDIKLPDIEGTKLLNLLHETTPKMVKIIVTGHPDITNSIEALNYGADAYLVKPVHLEDLIELIETKLDEQKEAEDMTEAKIASFLETRTKKLLERLK